MIIIHSFQFVSPELQAEVGPIPLCMLPIGNRKMLEWQVSYFRQHFLDEKIVVTLPKEYQLTINEQTVIHKLGIDVQRVHEHFSLASAMLEVLNVESFSLDEQVRILQGDRLLCDIPIDVDCIAIDSHYSQNAWCNRYECQDTESHWLGYFAFSSKANLKSSLTSSISSFTQAIVNYQDSTPLRNVYPLEWFNCSYYNSYFDARSRVTTQRSFNALNIEAGIVTKTSDHDIKIQAEIYWFSHLPPKLKRFIPQLIDSGRLQDGITTYYCLEFLPLLPLNELYVHGRNPIWFWHDIFDLVKDYFGHAASQEYLPYADRDKISDCRDDLYRRKTLGRLSAYQELSQIDFNNSIYYQGVALGSITTIAQNCIDKILSLPNRPVIMHGDLCFSNMLFDSRGRMLKLIDPRGLDCHENFSIFGDMTYDLAKLAHSVIGMYDFIIAGRFEISRVNSANGIERTISFDTDERLESIQHDFLKFQFIDDIDTIDIMPAVVLLFLSMLPLHADRPDRQEAMLVNAFRIYKRYVQHNHLTNDNSNHIVERYNDILER